MLPGESAKGVPGCRKGWFCSREGARRGFGVQKRVVLHTGIAHGGGLAGGAPQGGTCHPRHGSGGTAPKGWWGESEGRTPDRGGAAPPARGAGRVVLLPGESAKGVRGAKSGGFAHGRVCGEGPGCKKGWFCSQESPRKGFGVQKGWFCTRGWLMEAGRREALPREGRATRGMEAGRPPRRGGGVSPKDELPTGEAPHHPLGVQEGVVLLPGESTKGVRGAGRPVLLPGGCEKRVRGAGRVVLLPGESAKGSRGAEPLSFAPGRAVKTREEVKKWLKYRGIC